MKFSTLSACVGLLGALLSPVFPDSTGRTPVLVELFTSEGCSSCPPADDVLARLQKTQPVGGAEVIALGEHVDYWNQSGWADPFSSRAFSARQNSYAQFFRREGVYTPQMIVDGHTEFVGSDGDRARQAIAQAARGRKVGIEIGQQPNKGRAVRLSVRVGALPVGLNDIADVVLAITEDGLQSHVEGGENGGRTLAHVAVVRQMRLLGASTSGTFSPVVFLASGWQRRNLRAVVFVQERGSRRIVGVAQARLN